MTPFESGISAIHFMSLALAILVAWSPRPLRAQGTGTAPDTYFADPDRNVFAAGRAFEPMADGRPKGWDDPAAFDTGHARIAEEDTLEVDNIDGTSTQGVRAILPLDPAWKELAVGARIRSEGLQNASGRAGVRLSFQDKDRHDIRVAGDLIDATIKGTYQGWKVKMTSLAVPANAATLVISVEVSQAAGKVFVQRVIVTPIDPAKEPPPAQVTALHRAIKRNDSAALRKLIEADPRLLESRNMDYDCGTPLMGAAWTGSADAMLTLLNLGADIHAVDQNWSWPMMNWACFWCHPQALAVLIEHGATTEALPSELIGIAQEGKRRHATITDKELQDTIDVINKLPTTQPAHAATTQPQ
jgi:hypothetical protein